MVRCVQCMVYYIVCGALCAVYGVVLQRVVRCVQCMVWYYSVWCVV